MATRIYMGVLAVVLLGAIVAGTHHAIPPWVAWLLGIALAIGIALVGFIILGQRILRGDFDPARRSRQG